jgi:HEAT repeat protein
MFKSVQEAIEILQNFKLPSHEREQAIQYLSEQTGDEVLKALVSALHDGDFGIRWAASEALLERGEVGLKAFLLELASPRNDYNLREIAIHFFHNIKDPNFQVQAAKIEKTLKGPDPEITSMEAANKWLIELSSHH